jgi:hypothetical protein
MSTQDSPFRGYRGIEIIRNKVMQMALWLRQYARNCRHITLYRREYDLIKRWPKAGAFWKFEYRDGRIYFDEFELKPDSGVTRYKDAA